MSPPTTLSAKLAGIFKAIVICEAILVFFFGNRLYQRYRGSSIDHEHVKEDNTNRELMRLPNPEKTSKPLEPSSFQEDYYYYDLRHGQKKDNKEGKRSRKSVPNVTTVDDILRTHERLNWGKKYYGSMDKNSDKPRICCNMPSLWHQQEVWALALSTWLHPCDVIHIFVDNHIHVDANVSSEKAIGTTQEYTYQWIVKGTANAKTYTGFF
ncbi:hypothetical protein RFI_39748, partial [Reticulomyxa filosa]